MPKEDIINISNIHTKIPNNLKEFDPSYITRYAITSELVSAAKSKTKNINSILDVGGYNGALSKFLKNEKITIVDIAKDTTLKNYVRVNSVNLPFKDNEFDIVVSCDTLEHIKPKERDQFIAEMIRVSKHYVFICAPFGSDNVTKAEYMADSFYKSMSGESYVWLKEHREYGLPKKDWIRKAIRKSNCFFDEFDHSSIDLWTLMLSSSFFLAGNILPVNKEFYDRLRQGGVQYAKDISFVDFPPEGYRTFFAISKNNKIKVNTPKYNKEIVDDYFLHEIKNIGKVLRDINGSYGAALEKLDRFKNLVDENNRLAGELKSLRANYENIIGSRSYVAIEKISHIKNALRKPNGKKK